RSDHLMSRDFGSRIFRARGNCLQRVTRPEAPEKLQSLKALNFPCSREVRLDPVMRPALLRERIWNFGIGVSGDPGGWHLELPIALPVIRHYGRVSRPRPN